jgi:purine nucleosidase
VALPVVIDTDPGVDDALALLLAAASPELEVLAITTVAGNVTLDRATDNARRIATLAWEGREPPPIFRGRIGGDETAEEVHGVDGLGGAATLVDDDDQPLYPATLQLAAGDAGTALISLVEAHPGEITLITLGPLTNLAEAIREAPSVMAQIREVVVMGGVFREAGNTTAVAEFNIYADPVAAQVVCDSGLPARWIPLDVTHRCKLTQEDLERLPATRRARFVRDALDWYMRYHQEGFGEMAAFLHDPLAVGAAIWPELLRTTHLRVDVETSGGLTQGMTVADFRPLAYQAGTPPNARVALEVDADEFVRRFLARLA